MPAEVARRAVRAVKRTAPRGPEANIVRVTSKVKAWVGHSIEIIHVRDVFRIFAPELFQEAEDLHFPGPDAGVVLDGQTFTERPEAGIKESVGGHHGPSPGTNEYRFKATHTPFHRPARLAEGL